MSDNISKSNKDPQVVTPKCYSNYTITIELIT